MKGKPIDFILAIFIVGLSFYAWCFLPRLMIRGDGYVYLVRRFSEAFLGSFPTRLASFDFSAGFLGKILANLFGVNIPLYYATSLGFMLLIDVFFFFLVLVLTKNKLASFASAVIFSISYVGQWGMFADFMYAFFLERIPLMLLLIPSFIFLHLFLEKSKFKYYLTSLLLYSFGIGIAHWGVLFTGFYLFYPLFWQLFKKSDKKQLIKAVGVGLSYLLVSGFFIALQFWKYAGYGPKKWTFISFLLNPGIYHYPSDMLRQLVYWSEFPVMLKGLSRFFGYLSEGTIMGRLYAGDPQTYLNVENAKIITPYVAIIYSLAFVIIYKKLPKFRGLLFALLFSTASIFYLNAYFGQYLIPSQSGPNRYLYLPTYPLSIFWGLFLWAVFLREQIKTRWKILGLLVVAGYYIVNYMLISKTFEAELPYFQPTALLYDRIKSERATWDKGTTVIVSPVQYFASYEAEFFNDQIGKGEITFLSEEEAKGAPLKKGEKVVKIVYDTKCDCIKENILQESNK